jgi:tRNA A37 methylthiotransferase MiaB
MTNSKKINVITLECSKNIVDSEKLLKQISSGGFEITHKGSFCVIPGIKGNIFRNL